MRMRISPSRFETQSTYYVRGDESRQAQNIIVEFTISLKTLKRNLFTTHLNVGLSGLLSWGASFHYFRS